MNTNIKNTNCRFCETTITSNFCENCGAAQKIQRINATYVINQISDVLNFEKGFLYTLRELTIRPGAAVKSFINEDRNRLVKPIVFIIVCSLIYSLANQVFGFEDGYVGYSFETKSTTTILFQWVSQNYGYANILMGVLIAWCIKLFFRKSNYNFFEILILLCFTMGVGMLLFAVFGIIDSLISYPIIDKGFFIGVLYIIWAIANFFGKRKLLNYPKAFFAYFMGMCSFFLVLMVLGTLIDLFAAL